MVLAKLENIIKHPLVVAAGNILLVLLLYSGMRYFCYAVNSEMFPDARDSHLWEIMLGGMRFDLTAVLYLSSLYIIGILLPIPGWCREDRGYQKLLWWLFVLPNALGIIVNSIDIAYIRFTDRRTTCTFFSEFSHDHHLWRILAEGIFDYWYVALFCVAMVAVMVLCSRREFWIVVVPPRVYYSTESLIFAATLFFCVIGIRGGFGRYTRPITISNAMQYAGSPRETALILNTPFSLMKSIENRQYVEPQYFSPEELPLHMTPVHPAKQRIWQDYNVVVIILESFSKEYIGFYNRDIKGYDGYTPFLDSLLARSVTFEHSFASGRKSIDAMPSVLSSIPSLLEPYIVTPYSTNAVSSIADCLEAKGYTTAFFHGAPNGSMGFQAYARSAGFDNYYGMDEFGNENEFDGTWAIWDEPFLQYYAIAMSGMQEPFMTAVFTASSHHPFKVPEQYTGHFPKGNKPIHETIGYADHALHLFFETAKKQSWYKHTLFVITADHTNEATLPDYMNAKGLFEVPLAFFDPGSEQGFYLTEQAVSQTDIMPTVLNWLGYDQAYFAFGEDALDPATNGKEHPYAICYNDPYFQIFSDSLMVQFDGERVTAVYDYVQDRRLQYNIAATVDPQRIAPMTDYLKAYIQQYIHRMIYDRLRVEN